MPAESIVLKSSVCSATINTYGATLTNWTIEDCNGELTDIVVGWDGTPPAPETNPYFGCVVGRVANRIAHGAFELNEKRCEVTLNRPPNHLHGGAVGFCFREWSVVSLNGESSVTLKLVSDDGEEGYPGKVVVQVTYTLTGSDLEIEYFAQHSPDSPHLDTIVNLTNHSYFNLSGGPSKTILDHIFCVNATKYAVTDERLIPTGVVAATNGTPLDFSVPATLGSRIAPLVDSYYKGFDHFYLLDNNSNLKHACTLKNAPTGLQLSMHTTYPGFQLYTGNWVANFPTKSSHKIKDATFTAYNANCGVCLEAQFVPDAVNHKQWRDSVILKPGQVYAQKTLFKLEKL